jgi:hypothetical protein
VRLLAAGRDEVGGWKALRVSADGELQAEARDGRVVLPWAADYMTWNAGTVPPTSPAIAAARAREVWIPGVATERARAGLRAAGFELRDKRPLNAGKR